MTNDERPNGEHGGEYDSAGPEVGSHEERLNGADLYFEVLGAPAEAGGAGTEPVVFLHGGPGYNAYSFGELFGEAFAEVLPGRSLILLDQRGSGRSGPLADTDQGAETLDLDTLVADLEALREYLDVPRLVPLGHGFGALIALEYARRFPERVARVVVVNPWIHFPELALTLLRGAAALRGVETEDPAPALREQTPEGEHPPVGAARVEAAFALLNARDLLSALHFTGHQSRMHLEFVEAESQLLGSGEVQQALVNQGLWEFEYPPFLTELRRPVFILAGLHDRTSYPEQTEWVADLAGGDVTVLDAGHYPWLDDAPAFAEALAEALER